MIPKGYKELGILPSDWQVVRLGEVCDFLKTYGKSRSELSEIKECTDSVDYIHYGDIHTRFKHFLDIDKDTLPSIDSKKLEKNLEDIVFIKNGDLVIADASEDYDDIGKSVEVRNLSNPTVSGLHTILCRDKSSYFANGYKGYIFSLYSVHKQIKRLACGISVLGISKTNLAKVQIPLPPLAEQEKIASVLSTWDTQIQNLQSLITEKQNLKKGLAQTLLTAKTRFKGFSEEWQVVRLGEVCQKMQTGGTPKTTNKKYYGGQIPFVKIADITMSGKYLSKTATTITEEGLKNSSAWLVDENNILYAMYASFGFVSINKIKVATSQAIMCITPKHNLIYLDYLFYILANIQNKIQKYVETGTQGNLNAKNVKNLQIPLPPLAEQEKIAEILSEVDNEITLLEQKLESLKSQKKGLMQILLSGKVRVKI